MNLFKSSDPKINSWMFSSVNVKQITFYFNCTFWLRWISNICSVLFCSVLFTSNLSSTVATATATAEVKLFLSIFSSSLLNAVLLYFNSTSFILTLVNLMLVCTFVIYIHTLALFSWQLQRLTCFPFWREKEKKIGEERNG